MTFEFRLLLHGHLLESSDYLDILGVKFEIFLVIKRNVKFFERTAVSESILHIPDSSFSLGVITSPTMAQLMLHSEHFHEADKHQKVESSEQRKLQAVARLP